MVEEIKNFLEKEKVFFGIKECLKKSKELEKVIVSNDCREDIKRILSANKINFVSSNFTKEEMTNKLGLDFNCEVYGLKR